MNYFDYVNSLEPNSDLKDSTRARVQEEIAKKNIRVRKKKIAYLSTAACFALFATVITVIKSTNYTPNIIPENSTNNIIVSTTHGNQTTTNDKPQNQTTSNYADKTTEKAQTPTSKKADTTDNIGSNDIKINVTSDGNKYGAQKIKIKDKVYVQYCSNGNKTDWGDDNGNVTINKSDIGDLVCTLEANNLIELEHWDDYACMSNSQANKCKFNKAKIYEFKKCKNGTQLLAKTDSDYYLFYLSDFTAKVTVSQVIDTYSASGSNTVKNIEVNNSHTISDRDKLTAIIDTLKLSKNNYSLKETISKGYIDNNDEGIDLIITFADGTKLKAIIYNNYFVFSVVQKDDYGYYSLSDNQYSSLSKLLNE